MIKLRRPPDNGPQRKYGDKAEKSLTRRGYLRTPGSGSSGAKGDLRRGDLMLEMKATRAESFRVTAEVMGKLRNDKLTNGKDGVLIVRLGDGREYAVMEIGLFEKLVPDAG